ncbi:hypothetical protein PF010_g18338 [Phytophthora fragariae]|uniref:Uncharacterized protein n=1 Tax=Phytophthora fragariae TaxID=53985 RepID=A0A6G0MF60_9STRA|nr:hypothetical protein PF010_g18338 [Phytophthora fragariae]KAE9165960.1 hypothetical protein PF004_g29326 [Phytophthora fragariae]
MDLGGETQPKKRKRKYRKSTHAILKEEKEALLVEIDTLTERLEDLKTKTFGNPQGEEERDRRCKDKMVENRLLRRADWDQQDQFTAVHALTNEYSLTDTEVGSSLHRFIHLDKGESSRRAALMAMKDDVITRGLHLLQRRKPQIHQPWRPMHEDHGFEASSGDYYASSFAVMPFKRFSTVQQAFAALITYFSNLEISRSENFGSVTIREDNDSFKADVAQNRLVTTTRSGHQMESNTVFFSKLVEEGTHVGQQRGFGIVVCDFVDEDDRYPFHSETRVRRDLSSVLEISSYARQKPRGAKGEQEVVVVLTRWVYTRLHYPGFTMPPDHWESQWDMCQNTEQWMQLLRPSILETLT